jgi:spore maturation protein CgeB
MRIVMFCQTVLSDWNHGDAHFLRGIATELLSRGHGVSIFEPQDSASLHSLLAQYGEGPLRRFREIYPGLTSQRYELGKLDLNKALEGADVVLVHEWNDPALVRRAGEHRSRKGGYALFFHDTGHRLAAAPESLPDCELSSYDGVLACSAALRELYEKSGRVRRTWTWHQAVDTRVFQPAAKREPAGDLIWIGNWGGPERVVQVDEFLVQPSRALSLKTRVHGIQYPAEAVRALGEAGIDYAGWLPDFEAPGAFAKYRCTIHIPRRTCAGILPGFPTMRIFEALACGIPLVSAPWDDAEGLFRPGKDFLVARDGREMTEQLRALRHDPEMSCELAQRGLETVRARHTCAHRVNELLAICVELNKARPPRAPHPEVMLEEIVEGKLREVVA